jgi:hypothetical protein
MRIVLPLLVSLWVVSADAQTYQHYGADLYRVPRYGTLEVERYRGTSTIPKKTAPQAWFYRRGHERRPAANSRPGWSQRQKRGW